MTRILSVFKFLKRVGFAVLVLGSGDSTARTWVVATDGTGDYLSVKVACDSALAGDTIRVMPGEYTHVSEIEIDSGVVVYADVHGTVRLMHDIGLPSGIVVTMRGRSTLIGVVIVGDLLTHYADMIRVVGGPATIFNCELINYEVGEQIKLQCNGQPARIERCSFAIYGFYFRNLDSTTIWAPHNYFNGLSDTSFIHRSILDGRSDSTLGHIHITPLWDRFEWLPVQEDPWSPRELDSSPLIRVYPNPLNGPIQLWFSRSSGAYEIIVTDVLGRTVAATHRLPFQERLTITPANPLPSGTYFTIARNKEEIHVERFLFIK